MPPGTPPGTGGSNLPPEAASVATPRLRGGKGYRFGQLAADLLNPLFVALKLRQLAEDIGGYLLQGIAGFSGRPILPMPDFREDRLCGLGLQVFPALLSDEIRFSGFVARTLSPFDKAVPLHVSQQPFFVNVTFYEVPKSDNPVLRIRRFIKLLQHAEL